MINSIKLTSDSVYINGSRHNCGYAVGIYNGISPNQITTVSFREFLTRENITDIPELILEYGTDSVEMLEQILQTKTKIDSLIINNWNSLKDNDKAILGKYLADKNYLFETNNDTLIAKFESGMPEKQIPVLIASGERPAENIKSNELQIDDIFDKAVRKIASLQKDTFIINVGSMDGTSEDELAGYTASFGFRGLYVEPIPYIFEMLKSNYSNDNLFENSAISTFDGEVDMLTISPDAINEGKVHYCFRGMSSIYPPKNGLGSSGDKQTVERYGYKIKVPCLTFESLLNKHNITKFDILKIDTEGHDWEIFNTVDLSKHRPSVIRLEWFNLDYDDKVKLLKKFEDNGYLYEMLYGDITGITKELHNKIIGIEEDEKVVPPVNTALTVTPTDSKRYKIECEITTIGDIFSLLYNTFSEVTNLKVTPVFEAVPIKFTGGVCKTPDYTLILYPDGISLVFDPISRESGAKYVLDKDTDESVEKWLETMDSEQVYKLAQLTFRKVL